MVELTSHTASARNLRSPNSYRNDWLQLGIKVLSEKMSGQLANIESTGMLCAITGKGRAKIISEGPLILSDIQQKMFVEFLERRLSGEPYHYILGEKEFFSRRFFIDRNVLIPRPETEELVEWMLAYVREHASGNGYLNLLDIGTGSGVIPITLVREALKYGIRIQAVATDISQDALDVALTNARTYSCEDHIIFRRANLFSGLGHLAGNFDLIISNPPYIPTRELASLAPEVRLFEPLRALDGGSDGLHFVLPIMEGAQRFLKKGGSLFLEVADSGMRGIREIAATYETSEFRFDSSGKRRFLMLRS